MDKVENPTGRNPFDREFAEIFSKYLPSDLKSKDSIRVLSVGCGFAYEATGLLDALPQVNYTGIDSDEAQVEAAVQLHKGVTPGRFRAEVADAFLARNLGEDNDLIIVRNPNYTANRSTQKIQTSWTDIFGNCIGALKIGGYMFLTSTDKAELEQTIEIVNQDNRIQIINGMTQNEITQSAKYMPFKDDYVVVAKRIA